MTGGMFIVAILGALALFVIAAELLIRLLEPRAHAPDAMSGAFEGGAVMRRSPLPDPVAQLRDRGAL